MIAKMQGDQKLKLITRWQNSAGERVRIALNLKGIDYDYCPVNSVPPETWKTLNPQGLLPALVVDGEAIAQSSAILDYLDETFSQYPLLPADKISRAKARAFAALIASEMHALTVLRVREKLKSSFSVSEQGTTEWVHHWLHTGFSALEKTLESQPSSYKFCFGDTPGWAELHLVPQLSNGRRLGCDISSFTRLLDVEKNCIDLDAFRLARPEFQPDFPVADGIVQA
jgi:maleylpyruvate isomerase